MGSWRIGRHWAAVLLWLFLVACACLVGAIPMARSRRCAPPTSCFSGAKINDAGLQEIETGVQAIYKGLKRHANDDHPSIQDWTVRRKGSPAPPTISNTAKRAISSSTIPTTTTFRSAATFRFKKGKTTADIQAALKNVGDAWVPIRRGWATKCRKSATGVASYNEN